MSEQDRAHYWALKSDPLKYAAYLERKRRQRQKAQQARSYETIRKRRWRAANKELAVLHRAAGHAIEYAIECGKMSRPDRCSQCGAVGEVEGHHHRGYAPEHWLDVLWLCQACHSLAHHPARAA